MFSNLIRQQARLALSTRLTLPLHRQSQKSLFTLSTTTQKSQILSQRTFSISRSLFEESPISQDANAFRTEASTNTDTGDIVGVNPKQRALYVTNLPFSAEKDEVRQVFEPYGEVVRVVFGTDGEGRQRGYGFVEFANAEDATAALESGAEEPFVLFHRTLRVQYAKNLPKSRKSLEKRALPPNPTIHIANFPVPGDDRLLRDMLRDYEDHLLRITFMKDGTGDYTRKVFVQFSDQETATAVLERFQEKDLEGTNLKIYYAKERFQRERTQAFDA